MISESRKFLEGLRFMKQDYAAAECLLGERRLVLFRGGKGASSYKIVILTCARVRQILSN